MNDTETVYLPRPITPADVRRVLSLVVACMSGWDHGAVIKTAEDFHELHSDEWTRLNLHPDCRDALRDILARYYRLGAIDRDKTRGDADVPVRRPPLEWWQ